MCIRDRVKSLYSERANRGSAGTGHEVLNDEAKQEVGSLDDASSSIDKLAIRDSKFLDTDGSINWEKWAPNGGRVPGTIKSGQTLDMGLVIDRYGNKFGKYTAPINTPYEQRALPYLENPLAYHKYEVIKPIHNVTCLLYTSSPGPSRPSAWR